MSKYVRKLVVDGHMTHTSLGIGDDHVRYMQVKIFSGAEVADGEEPISEWDMPVVYDYDSMATLAVRQSSEVQALKEKKA